VRSNSKSTNVTAKSPITGQNQFVQQVTQLWTEKLIRKTNKRLVKTHHEKLIKASENFKTINYYQKYIKIGGLVLL